MAAFDDAETRAAEQHERGRDHAGAMRHVTLDPGDQAGRRFAVLCRFWAAPIKTQALAQQHDRPNGGRSQVSLRPQRSQRSNEGSGTIHCTNSSNVAANTCGYLAQMTSGLAKRALKVEKPLLPQCAGRKSAQLTRRQPSAKMRRQR